MAWSRACDGTVHGGGVTYDGLCEGKGWLLRAGYVTDEDTEHGGGVTYNILREGEGGLDDKTVLSGGVTHGVIVVGEAGQGPGQVMCDNTMLEDARRLEIIERAEKLTMEWGMLREWKRILKEEENKWKVRAIDEQKRIKEEAKALRLEIGKRKKTRVKDNRMENQRVKITECDNIEEIGGG